MTLPLKGLIIVLGSPNSDDGELYSMAKERCELALTEYAKRSDWKFLLTGGYGSHFNATDQPHAAYLKRYLIRRGVPMDEIVVEFVESKNTLEDASLSKPIVLKYGVPEIEIVTSDFHLDRARYIFERAYNDIDVRLNFMGSPTKTNPSQFDLEALKLHEKQALAKLKASES